MWAWPMPRMVVAETSEITGSSTGGFGLRVMTDSDFLKQSSPASIGAGVASPTRCFEPHSQHLSAARPRAVPHPCDMGNLGMRLLKPDRRRGRQLTQA